MTKEYKVYYDTGCYFMNIDTMKIDSESYIEKIDMMLMNGINKDLVQFVKVNDLNKEENKEHEENERYLYRDFTMEDMECYYINVENFKYEEV